MPLTLGLVVSSFLSGQIVSRTGKYKIILLAGIAIVLVGYILMLGLSVNTSRWDVTWRMILLGIGIGPGMPIYTLAVQNAVSPREVGAATSSSQFFRQIGSTIGVAVFGTILASVLATQLPKYMPNELRGNTGKMGISMGQLESGNFTSVSDQIKASMQDTYGKIEAVLTRNDQAALQALLADQRVPADMKTMLQGGGIATQVHTGIDAQYRAIAGALQSGRPAALAAVLADPRLSPPLKDEVGKIPVSVLANPPAVRGVLDRIRRGLDAEEPALVEQVTRDTLAKIRTTFDAQAATLTTGVTTALRKAFTEAIDRVYFWGVLVIVLGFIVTLFLPELELRKTTGVQAMAAEGGAPPEGTAPAAESES